MSVYGEEPEVVAEILVDLYRRNFAGRQNTRFWIWRKDLKIISRLNILSEEYVQKVQAALKEMDAPYALVDMDAYFVVLFGNNLANSRRVTREALERALSDMCKRHNKTFNYKLTEKARENDAE